MRLTNSKEIMEFRYAVAKCKGDVWLEDQEGNKFNLKSVISQYIYREISHLSEYAFAHSRSCHKKLVFFRKTEQYFSVLIR